MNVSRLFSSLFISVLESVLNNLLFQYHSMNLPRKLLIGKTLRIEIKELTFSIILIFSEQHVTVLEQYEDDVDCIVYSRILTLLKLRDSQILSVLIDCGEIIVEGEIQVVQQLLSLLYLAEWDLAEWLAPYIGDIAAQTITQALDSKTILVQSNIQRWHDGIIEILTEEWRIIPSPIEVMWFKEEVNTIFYSTQELMARIKDLEVKQ